MQASGGDIPCVWRMLYAMPSPVAARRHARPAQTSSQLLSMYSAILVLVFVYIRISIWFAKSAQLLRAKCWRHSIVLGKTLNSSVVLRTTLNSLGAIWEMIPSVAAICAAAVDFPCWSYPTFCVASLHAGPVGCISYNMYLFQSSLIAAI